MKKIIAFVLAILSAVLAFVTLRWLTKSREEIDWQDATRPGKILHVDGIPIHYVEAGAAKKPCFVMVHGFGGHTFSFRHQVPEFSRDHHVIAFDLKGFGYSGRPEDGDYSLTEQARLMLGAMDALGVRRAALMGHSMGGEVVMRMAATAPERVERLVLAASVDGRRFPFLPRLPFLRPFMPGLARLVRRRNFGRKMFYDPSRLDVDAIYAAYLKPMLIHGTLNTFWQMWGDVPGDRPIDYSSITQPVLILAAEKERVIPFYSRVVAHLRGKLPQAQVVTVERTGHLLLEENPTSCNDLIRSFVAPGPADLRGETVATAL